MYNSFWTHVVLITSIKSTDNQWNSNGKMTQGSQQTVEILEEFQNMMISELQCEPEQFKGRIIFMSMYNDIDWSKNQTETSQAHAHRVSDYACRFQRGHWSFLGTGYEQKWYRTHANKLDGMGSGRRFNAFRIRRKPASYLPCLQTIVKRRIRKQRRWEEIHAFPR